MSDHIEEQEMESQALEAIFDAAFETISSTPPFQWSVKLVPVDCGGDEEEEEKENHVAVKLLATIPAEYPECLPVLDVEVIKGLAEDQRKTILDLANDEAQANEGMPVIFAVCEAVRAWLLDNNVKGLDDGSMHAQMMRKMKEAERSKAQAQQQFEAQKKVEEITEAELEEIAVRKRREEGTPCNEENFLKWKAEFEAEMAQKREEEAAEKAREKSSSGKKKGGINIKSKEEEQEGRLTGFEQFSSKAGILNLDDIEKAAESAEADDEEDEDNDVDVDDLDVDEDLFDDDDDLDDLDFDDSDEDDEDIDI